MTEKRFVQKDESIINTQTDELVNASSEESAKIIVSWLNELSDKKAELMKENYCLLDGLAYRDEVEIPKLSERISDLECENEQLKTKNNAYLQDIEMFKEENTTLKLENEQLKHDATVLICSNQEYRKENEQLKSELKALRKKYNDFSDMVEQRLKQMDIGLVK